MRPDLSPWCLSEIWGEHGWCGPAALSTITGCSTDEMALILKEAQDMIAPGFREKELKQAKSLVHDGEVVVGCGYMDLLFVLSRLEINYKHWVVGNEDLRSPLINTVKKTLTLLGEGVYILGTRFHIFGVHKRSSDRIFVADSLNLQPVEWRQRCIGVRDLQKVVLAIQVWKGMDPVARGPVALMLGE